MRVPLSARAHKRVLLCITGGVAVYKSCEVLRALQKAGCEVRVCASANALKFVGAATFEALCRYPVAQDLFGFSESEIPHIDLTEWADLIVVVPATANILAKVAHGIADDCVSTTLLAADSDVLIAPAMNMRMWNNPATKENVATLKRWGYRFVEPDSGRLACGDIGTGKLASVAAIAEAALVMLWQQTNGAPLAGKHVMITAGPTHEAIDPVRYIANASSGKMGFALARACVRAGAQVSLIAGPTTEKAPEQSEMLEIIRVTSAEDMLSAARSAFERADAAFFSAAVADYRPKASADHKLKKTAEHLETLALVENPDILATLAAEKGGRVVVGFAAETNNLLEAARAKLATKGCDLLVANDVSQAESTFGSDTNHVWVLSSDGTEEVPCMSKDELADALVERVGKLLRARGDDTVDSQDGGTAVSAGRG